MASSGGQAICPADGQERKMNQVIKRIAACSLAALGAGGAYGQETLLQRTVEQISSPNVAQDLKLSESQTAESNQLFIAFQSSRDDEVKKIAAASGEKVDELNAEIGRM